MLTTDHDVELANTDPTFPRVWSYELYRNFLKDAILARKRKDPRVSYAFLARRLRVDTSYFKHIVSGRKNLGTEKISVVASLFGLEGAEREYFTLLVLKDTSRDTETRQYLEKIATSFQMQHGPGGRGAAMRTIQVDEASVSRIEEAVARLNKELEEIATKATANSFPKKTLAILPPVLSISEQGKQFTA